jgi:glycosyltransferase involved in cell wall biosynthesis
MSKNIKIAIDISSLNSESKLRGIGYYTQYLVKALKKFSKDKNNFEIITFEKKHPQADLYHFPAFLPFHSSLPLQLIKQSIVTIHDLIPLDFPKQFPSGFKAKVHWRKQRKLLKKSLHIITDSKASQKSITKHTKIKSDKITPIHLAVNPKQELSKIKLYRSLPEKFVLYVGDFNWNKNVLNLTKACVDQNIPLIVVGKQATNFDIDRNHPWNLSLVEFQNYVKENKNLIKCLGYVSDQKLTNLFQLATIYCCPSYAEGFGLPLLDALTSGVPCLSSNQTSLPEIGGDACLYFNPFKKNDLKIKLKKLWQDSDLRTDLISKALIQAQKFSWEFTAQKTYEVYKKALA